MTVARSVTEVLSRHVTFEIESIDRLYLNIILSFCGCRACDLRRLVADSVFDETAAA